jgi:hypothetical protein
MKLLTFALLLPFIMQADDWSAVRNIAPGARVSVTLLSGKYEDGRIRAVSADAVDISTKGGVRTLHAAEVRRMYVREKASRWKGAMVGALIGFGARFAIGAPSAGYLTDRNSPSMRWRLLTGAGVGIYGAGIGAPLGALAGGSKNVTVYQAERKKR